MRRVVVGGLGIDPRARRRVSGMPQGIPQAGIPRRRPPDRLVMREPGSVRVRKPD